MAHVITQACCNDASCVPVCPVDAIHPTPDEPGYGRSEMLYIDPVGCIDCGACIDACPVDAIVPDYDLTPQTERYEEVNAAYYSRGKSVAPEPPPTAAVPVPALRSGLLRVAIVGSGPSACYAAEELLSQNGGAVEISVFEKLPTPFGLIRFGVAPDHQGTKSVAKMFQKTASHKNLDFYLNVEVGRHISHEELLEHHDAVIYAVGAPGDQKLGIPGEELPGCHSATEFVAWYNGHPDHADRKFDLSGERAVIIGNGNVALDVARVLVSDPAALVRTDIAQHALEALAESNIKEVVVVGRRGPAQAAFTNPELLGLGLLPDVDVTAPAGEVELDEHTQAILASHPDPIAELKARLVAEHSIDRSPSAARRIALRFLLSPMQIRGTERVAGVRFARNELISGADGSLAAMPTASLEDFECGLILRSVGYRGVPVAGFPVSGSRATLKNAGGRVLDSRSGAPIPGVYTAGWIKRGPSGVIGTNKKCASETIANLLEDFHAGCLASPQRDRGHLRDLVCDRQPEAFDYAGWKAIDSHERRTGRASGRPRVKLVDTRQMLDIAVASERPRGATAK
ncbi:MAG: 4Fe-4S dicluster domain-containing protein [Rhodococcus sp. (in: high G+C Gram-positive bacteria)]|nr:MAG: 4Fe-4S dicluster domain-containing protein [Rhodococcus sp. (in: high G+C Gram-positive bacteria)]